MDVEDLSRGRHHDRGAIRRSGYLLAAVLVLGGFVLFGFLHALFPVDVGLAAENYSTRDSTVMHVSEPSGRFSGSLFFDDGTSTEYRSGIEVGDVLEVSTLSNLGGGIGGASELGDPGPMALAEASEWAFSNDYRSDGFAAAWFTALVLVMTGVVVFLVHYTPTTTLSKPKSGFRRRDDGEPLF